MFFIFFILSTNFLRSIFILGLFKILSGYIIPLSVGEAATSPQFTNFFMGVCR